MKKGKIFIISLFILLLCGCGKKNLNSERYVYGLEGEQSFSYYKCDLNKNICKRYLYFNDIGESIADYEYELTKKQQDDTYLIKFHNLKDVKDSYTLIYNPKNDTLYDSDLKIEYNNSEFIGNKEKYEKIYNKLNKYKDGLSLSHDDSLNYENISIEENTNIIVLRKSRKINNNQTISFTLKINYEKGFNSNELSFIHTSFKDIDKREYDNNKSATGKIIINDSFNINGDFIDSSNIKYDYNGFDTDNEQDLIKRELKTFFIDTNESMKKQFDTSWYELGFFENIK